MDVGSIIGASISTVAATVAGLTAWGVHSKTNEILTEIKLVRSEMQTELAKAEIGFFTRVNGNYVHKERMNDLLLRVDKLENKVEDIE